MEDQRIKVETRRIELILSNGIQLSGETFLHLQGARQTGPERIGEILNGQDNFLPVRSKEGIELVNLEQVVSVAVSAEEEFDPLLELGEEHQIQVKSTLGDFLPVRIFVNLPGGKNRTKDFLNQDKRFLLFLYKDQVLYMARNKILRVKD
ncbi:MAG: hypothetical protein OQK50_00445 [Deltaproteobacteria bacterium]|jgi:hypothetical protein|nr:hypothetical protein [Deltaproteobacteria bacterium]MCW8893297.1 hypothetical protein [Deltaproteobacteria bacterium]MCW9048782.1 hypothetical protein [Deltaproteobacteria bacterium]